MFFTVWAPASSDSTDGEYIWMVTILSAISNWPWTQTIRVFTWNCCEDTGRCVTLSTRWHIFLQNCMLFPHSEWLPYLFSREMCGCIHRADTENQTNILEDTVQPRWSTAQSSETTGGSAGWDNIQQIWWGWQIGKYNITYLKENRT